MYLTAIPSYEYFERNTTPCYILNTARKRKISKTGQLREKWMPHESVYYTILSPSLLSTPEF